MENTYGTCVLSGAERQRERNEARTRTYLRKSR